MDGHDCDMNMEVQFTEQKSGESVELQAARANKFVPEFRHKMGVKIARKMRRKCG